MEKIRHELQEIVVWDEVELRHEKELKATADRTQQALAEIKSRGSGSGE